MSSSILTSPSPFHEHEQVLQQKVGKREQMEHFGRQVIRDYMPEQHREFYSQLPYVAVGSVDSNGDTWATLLAGPAGFISSPSPTQLEIALRIPNGDPLKESIHNLGSSLGLLGINLENRRRNRVNVRIDQVCNGVARLSVAQAFGNCPQYIQSRSLEYSNSKHSKSEQGAYTSFETLDENAIAMISKADTFFVSSFIAVKDNSANEGVDVSHRGGMPGFIKIDGDTLTIPDFPGNNHFNTLGNFLANPKAGLLFPDFNSGDLLSLTGTTEILWDGHPEVAFFKGAQRAWRFRVKKGLRLRKALPFNISFKQFSINSQMSGTWQGAAAREAAEKLRSEWQPMQLVKKHRESASITSFYFKHAHDKPLLPFKAGQYLTIKLQPSGQKKTLIRTLTVSSAPNETLYRISVKKELNGTASNYLHDHLKIGDIIEAKYPAGQFYIDASEQRPAVLIGAGVGITPMISMAQHIMSEAIRTRHARELYIYHSAKDSESRAFYQDFNKIGQSMSGKVRYYSFLTQPKAQDQLGHNYQGAGRISVDVFKQTLPLDDYDFFICGPSSFMQSIYDDLISLGVSDARIFAEAFGPATLNRTVDTNSQPVLSSNLGDEAEQSLIKFTRSQREQHWQKGGETLLDVAEALAITADSSCRSGLCGACATPIRSGEVSYRTKPVAPIPDGHALLCCAVPAKHSSTLEIDI